METIYVYALIGAGVAAILTAFAIALVVIELRRDDKPLSEFDAEIWHPHDDGERK